MESLKIIPTGDLPDLRDLYKVDYPLHISTHSTVQLFIERFTKHPKWVSKVKFLSFHDDWRAHGAFIMIHGNRVFFNTLEPFPFKNLTKALLLVEFEEKFTFVNIRDALRCVIAVVTRVHHYEIVSDIGTKCFLIPKDTLQSTIIEVPDDLELKPVERSDVKKINSAWPGKFENSEKFLEDLVEYNTSMGLYSKKGELIAWNMRLDSGSMGVGQVASNHEGNLFGHTVVAALAAKISKDHDCDVHFEIVHGNSGAEKSVRLSQLQLIGTQSWVSVKKKKKLSAAPLWGHL